MTEYEMLDGRLVVAGALEAGEQGNLERALALLVGEEDDELVCDLSRVDRISSTCLGLLGAFGVRAREGGKRISIIAHGRVYDSFREAGFGDFVG